ncbi:hypothetical protein O3M35_001347 [Rhynocoris fuscipes]|uniref:Uncharacterized protein n=1 Tax=Rhynocoris fuscipes TaxID=488301 RepID=A0AAW1DU64_9HEMI
MFIDCVMITPVFPVLAHNNGLDQYYLSIVTSEAGLKVVQIRGVCGAVLKSWEVGKKAICKHLVLPRMFQNKSVTLIAIDSNGNIHSQQI